MRNSVLFLFHIQKLQWHQGEPVVWGHSALPESFAWLGPVKLLICGLCGLSVVWFCFFFPLCSKSVNSPCPRQEPEVQGAEPADHLRPLLFECSCSQRRHPNLTQVSHVELEFCLPCLNSFSKADLHLSNS